MFWLFLYPGSITSLRHDWTHSGLPDESLSVEPVPHRPTLEAKAWIEKYAAGIGADYQEIMDAAANWVSSGEYLNHGPRFEGEHLPEGFWTHYELITGKKGEGSFFSCSC